MMARKITPQVEDYLNNLMAGDTEEAKRLQDIAIKLKRKNEDAFSYCASLIYSYGCPDKVAFLAFDISYKQLKANREANPQVIFEQLSRNDRSVYSAVKPCYIKAVEKIRRLSVPGTAHSENKLSGISQGIRESASEDNDEIITNSQNDNSNSFDNVLFFIKKFLSENRFDTNNEDYYVINTCTIPKSAWLLNVYAFSYEDYCETVKETIKEFNDNGITVFLAKPNLFKDGNVSKNKPKIAYSVLVNQEFKFTSISEKTIKYFDDGDSVLPMDGITIAKRASLTFTSFIGPCFTDGKGNILDNSQEYINSFTDGETILSEIQKIGSSEDVLHYYSEIKTGIVEKDNLQIYKPILCRTDDIIQIAKILKEIESAKLDFLIDSDKEGIKILFVHISHFSNFLFECNKKEIIIDAEPQLTQIKLQ